AIARRSRVGPGALRSHSQFHAVEPADASPTSSDRLDRKHRRCEPNASLRAFELQVELPVVSRNVGACPPHVEADRSRETGLLGDTREAHDTTSRSRQNAVLTCK